MYRTTGLQQLPRRRNIRQRSEAYMAQHLPGATRRRGDGVSEVGNLGRVPPSAGCRRRNSINIVLCVADDARRQEIHRPLQGIEQWQVQHG